MQRPALSPPCELVPALTSSLDSLGRHFVTPCNSSPPCEQGHDRLLIIGEGFSSASSPAFTVAPPPPGAHPHHPHEPSTRQFQGSALAGMPPPPQGSDLALSHVPLPLAYIGPNWPLLHTAVSANGLDIAVAGQRGLALYNRTSNK